MLSKSMMYYLHFANKVLAVSFNVLEKERYQSKRYYIGCVHKRVAVFLNGLETVCYHSKMRYL